MFLEKETDTNLEIPVSFPAIVLFHEFVTTNELVSLSTISLYVKEKKKKCDVTLRERSNKRERKVRCAAWNVLCRVRRDSSAHATGTGRCPFSPFFPQRRLSADVAPSRPSCARIRAQVPSCSPLWRSPERSSNFCPNLRRRAANRRGRCSAWS